ncbi:calcium binding EGF domain-containing protein [Cryptosporidium andersoni]|uniref:Calcium binding EGF domain-containing protein n=1 Tax=Cryptosporidium andersoni TaxID=117008 RepID=A0A1J4MRN7_9CRYT|nr:calcium binding EGF domain-containing protein [Cryptosporidium andersoni]
MVTHQHYNYQYQHLYWFIFLLVFFSHINITNSENYSKELSPSLNSTVNSYNESKFTIKKTQLSSQVYTSNNTNTYNKLTPTNNRKTQQRRTSETISIQESQYSEICSSLPKNINEIEERFWTHLVFMHADNNLESMALVDLAEMSSPLHPETVNYVHLVVYIDRCKDYTNKNVIVPIISCPRSGLGKINIKQEQVNQNFTGAYILYRWKLNKELEEKLGITFVWILIDDLGEVDSNSPTVLSNFITNSLDMFPSLHLALTLWNHGSGWVGFGDDHDNADGSGMHLDQMYRGIKDGINNSLRGSKNGMGATNQLVFDVLGFDACLMMQYDVLEIMRPLAAYILASEDNEPGHGWNFRTINPATKVSYSTNAIGNNSELKDKNNNNSQVFSYRAATPLEYVSRIVYGYSLHAKSYPLTLSAINTDLLDIFMNHLYNLIVLLYRCGGDYIGVIIKKSILNSRKIENCDIINLCSCFDLGDMLEQLRGYLAEEIVLDTTIQELLALTLNSYYNMQVVSVNIQRDKTSLSIDESLGNGSLWTGISLYFPNIFQSISCSNTRVAKQLSLIYMRQSKSEWGQYINDISRGRPGQYCNLFSSKFEEEKKPKFTDLKTSVKLIEDNNSHSKYIVMKMSNNTIMSQSIISYPLFGTLNKTIPISSIILNKVESKGIINIKWRTFAYEVKQKILMHKEPYNEYQDPRVKIFKPSSCGHLNCWYRSNITIMSNYNHDYMIGHFMLYETLKDLELKNGYMAYLTISNKNTSNLKKSQTLYMSTPGGVIERSENEPCFLIPIVYHIEPISSISSVYINEMIQKIQEVYNIISDTLNSITAPSFGIKVLSKYDTDSIKSRKVKLITSIQNHAIFIWGNESTNIKNNSLNFISPIRLNIMDIEPSLNSYSRILVSSYSEYSNGLDNLLTLGISINGKNFTRECLDEWINDGICDIFCIKDINDCSNIKDELPKFEIKYPLSNKQKYIINPNSHVQCTPNNLDLLGQCWEDSVCRRSSYSNKYYCICPLGYRHQIIKLINRSTGEILYRHNCEDIDECSEHSRQWIIEENEQTEGDLYNGYNFNEALYPSIERGEEISDILNSPFSFIKRHVVTPSGLKRPCHPNAVCINKKGSFDCKCKQGFHGDGKLLCIKDNLCSDYENNSSQAYSCPEGLHCLSNYSQNNDLYNDLYNRNITLKNICGCKTGYKMAISLSSKPICVDIDECKIDSDSRIGTIKSHQCSLNSICTNTIGSFICSCPVGWIGNGYICSPKTGGDIAIQVELSASFEKLKVLGYASIKNIFKQSIIEVLDIPNELIEITSLWINPINETIKIYIHLLENSGYKNKNIFSSFYKNKKSVNNITENSSFNNVNNGIKLLDLLTISSSTWYSSTYFGHILGSTVNPTKIISGLVEQKSINIIDKILLLLFPESTYNDLKISPYGNPIGILIFTTIFIWCISLFLIILTVILHIILFSYLKNQNHNEIEKNDSNHYKESISNDLNPFKSQIFSLELSSMSGSH